MKSRTFNCQAVVLKRSSVGETDRVVTLLSQEFGKFAVIAKGVRKLSSSKRAYLEPGNHINAYCVATSSMPLLTQASLISDTAEVRTSLSKMRHLHQLLEIFDQLFVENELEPELFSLILNTRESVLAANPVVSKIRSQLEQLILILGFQDPQDTKFLSISEYISSLTDRKMHSFEFLTVKS